jgi:hypothetical protein
MAPSVAVVKTYTLAEMLHADLVDAFGVRFAFDAPAGTCKPKNEQEEQALELALELGLVSVKAAKDTEG